MLAVARLQARMAHAATLVRPALRNGFPAVQQVAYKSGNYQASGGTSLQDGMEPGQFPGNPLGQVDPNAGRFDGGADEGGKGHWIKERWLSVALIPLFPGAYMFPGPVADTLLALMLPIHNHMGIDVLLTDYVKGVLDPIAKAVNYSLMAATSGGLLYFNYTDMGICEAMAKLWAL